MEMISKRPLGIGIIGCGRITEERHAPEYAESENARIVGCFDFVASRAEAIATRYGGTVFESVDALLACEEIDAVSVCTANATHAEITVAALRAGKHVLCEKPMATTREECESMLAAASDSGKRLMVAHNQRMCTVHQRAKALVSEGAIGRVLSVHTCFGHSGPDNWSVDRGTGNWFFDKKRSAFGATADLGVHKIDLVRFLTGSEIREVSAVLDTLDKKDAEGNPVSVDDNAAAIYRMENGAIVTMNASWTHYGEEDNTTTLYGSDGILKLSPGEGRILLIKRDGTHEVWEGLTDRRSGVIDTFLSAILEGTPSPIDAKTVFPTMEALFGTIDSAKGGVRICLPRA